MDEKTIRNWLKKNLLDDDLKKLKKNVKRKRSRKSEYHDLEI